MGGIMPLCGTLIGACFGRRSFGRVMGLMSPMLLPIQVLGVPFAGYVYDRFHSYDLAFTTFVGLYGFSIVTLLLLRVPAREPSGSAASPAGPTTATVTRTE